MRILPLALLVLVGSALAQDPPQPPPWPTPPTPPQNPITDEKVFLGKALFWDEQLSSTGMTACGTCHIFEHGGSDPRTFENPVASTHPGPDEEFETEDDIRGSQGVIHSLSSGHYETVQFFKLNPQVTGFKSPSVVNSAFPPRLFWDGRAGNFFEHSQAATSALESQAAEPPESPVEMGHAEISWANIEGRLPPLTPLAWATDVPAPLQAFIGSNTYADLFNIAFGSPTITRQRVVMAIATYQRTLVSDQIRQVVHPIQPGTPEQRGGAFFDSPKDCGMCHSGARFTDDEFHDIFVPHAEATVKTPSLHGVELRLPLFHNGSKNSLMEVVEHYLEGPGLVLFEDPMALVHNLQPGDKEAIVAYMRTFTDERVRDETGPFTRPTLFSESDRVPVLYGNPTPRQEIAPEMIAVEPPSVENPNFTLGLRNAIGGGTAVLILGPDPLPVTEPAILYQIEVFVDPETYVTYPPVTLAGSGPGEGYTSRNLDLTGYVQSVGVSLYAQWAILDPGAQAPLMTSASEAVKFTLF